jgi:hypothetical protein
MLAHAEGGSPQGPGAMPEQEDPPEQDQFAQQSVPFRATGTNTNTNTKYTCDTGQTRNKLLAQWVHLAHSARRRAREYSQ